MNKHYYAVVRSGQKNDELKHWKYIRKYKKNGKWRYVYDVGTTGDIINGRKESPYREYSKLQDILGYDERDAAAIADINYRRKEENATYYNHSQSTNQSYSQKKYNRLSKEASAAGKKASEAMERYYKTPIGKIDRIDDVIDSGRKAIANILKKVANRIQPEEEYLPGKMKGKPVRMY